MARNFIAFEGIDGCGKGVQMIRLRNWLLARNFSVKHFSEPNDNNHVGQRIRKILKHELQFPDSHPEMQRLYILDRAQDLCGFVLNPNAQFVLAERFAWSTLAYGMLHGSVGYYIDLHQRLLGHLMRWPDMTYLLDVPSSVGLERRQKRDGVELPQFFEKQELLDKVRQNYLSLVEHHEVWEIGSAKVIDAIGSEEDVFAQIREDIIKRFEIK